MTSDHSSKDDVIFMFIGRNYEVTLDPELIDKVTPTEKNYFRGINPIRSEINDFIIVSNNNHHLGKYSFNLNKKYFFLVSLTHI